MKTLFKILLGLFAAAALFLGWVLFEPPAFFPHELIVISLPFAPEYDASTGMIPMGETIYHPKPQVPNGHPGIDFGWDNLKVPVIASADGTLTRINPGSSSGTDVTVQNGVYELRYTELQTVAPGLNVGQKIKKGDFIGYPGEFNDGTNGFTHYNLHWELASISVLKDRFCPMAYFDPDSRARIEAIWAKVPPDDNQGMKRQFPNICSGDYSNKTE